MNYHCIEAFEATYHAFKPFINPHYFANKLINHLLFSFRRKRLPCQLNQLRRRRKLNLRQNKHHNHLNPRRSLNQHRPLCHRRKSTSSLKVTETKHCREYNRRPLLYVITWGRGRQCLEQMTSSL